jgi:hypothetical protein
VQRLKLLKKKYWETKGSSLMCPASLHYSNVNLLDPTLGVPTRVGTGYLDDGTKVTDTRALARTRQRRPFLHYSRVQIHHDPLPPFFSGGPALLLLPPSTAAANPRARITRNASAPFLAVARLCFS